VTYDLTRLSDPFPPDRVSWRVGSTTNGDGGKVRGMALAYVDARDIMDRLDEVVGPANWQDKYRRDHETTICSLSIRVGNEWVTKEDGSGDTDVEAEKGALSKALVRAAVKWKIGRYLYDLDSPWVECEKRGKSTFIASHEKVNLKRLLERSYRPTPQARVETPKAETPFDDAGSDGAAAEYISGVKRQIAAHNDPGKLIGWWNSAEEKQARRDFELSQDDVASLKALLMKRIEALSPQKEAAQ
jgi:hypothetical protein